jgi:hypothetical protein
MIRRDVMRLITVLVASCLVSGPVHAAPVLAKHDVEPLFSWYDYFVALWGSAFVDRVNQIVDGSSEEIYCAAIGCHPGDCFAYGVGCDRWFDFFDLWTACQTVDVRFEHGMAGKCSHLFAPPPAGGNPIDMPSVIVDDEVFNCLALGCPGSPWPEGPVRDPWEWCMRPECMSLAELVRKCIENGHCDLPAWCEQALHEGFEGEHENLLAKCQASLEQERPVQQLPIVIDRLAVTPMNSFVSASSCPGGRMVDGPQGKVCVPSVREAPTIADAIRDGQAEKIDCVRERSLLWFFSRSECFEVPGVGRIEIASDGTIGRLVEVCPPGVDPGFGRGGEPCEKVGPVNRLWVAVTAPIVSLWDAAVKFVVNLFARGSGA